MSHATDAAIGMMDGAYFTSRKEILDFINNLLNLNLTKIEQTASGAVACQLTEYLFPRSIPMSKVNWEAKSSHEYVANYKLLQNAFTKNKIRKHVDVDKLIRGKYQDNLEFCQWLKAFFDQTSPMMGSGREGYDPVAVRAKGKGGKSVEKSKGGSSGGRTAIGAAITSSTRGVTNSSAANVAPRAAAPAKKVVPASTSRPSSSSSTSRKENIANTSSTGSTLSKPRKAEDSAAIRTLQEENLQLKNENANLQSQCTELETQLEEVEAASQNFQSERDFYFEKLRGIEIMLQVFKEKEESGEDIDLGVEARKVIDNAFKVMYATEQDNVEVDDEGNLVGVGGDISTLSSPVVDELYDERAQNELDQEEEQLLISEEPAISSPVNHFSSGEEEDLLTSGIEVPVQTYDEVGGTHLHQFSDDDLEDEELLTAGIDDGAPTQVDNNNDVSLAKPTLADHDDSFDDDNLLSD